MLTLAGYQNRIKQILEATNLDAGVAEELSELNREREEVDVVIRSYVSNYPNNDEIFDFTPETKNRSSQDDWESKYNDIKAKYYARFFGKDDTAIVGGDNAGSLQATQNMDVADDKIEEEEQRGIDSLFEEEDK